MVVVRLFVSTNTLKFWGFFVYTTIIFFYVDYIILLCCIFHSTYYKVPGIYLLMFSQETTMVRFFMYSDGIDIFFKPIFFLNTRIYLFNF